MSFVNRLIYSVYNLTLGMHSHIIHTHTHTLTHTHHTNACTHIHTY